MKRPPLYIETKIKCDLNTLCTYKRGQWCAFTLSDKKSKIAENRYNKI